MELRHLRYFVAVAEELNFRRAAERLFMAQPPLSQQIRQLEAEVGTPLFVRGPRRVSLTDAGVAFLEDALAILRRVDAAAARAAQIGRGDAGHLRVGFASSTAYDLLPRVVRRFRERYPDVQVELTELLAHEQTEALRQRRIQVGLAIQAESGDGILVEDVATMPLVVALPEAHPLALKPMISLADLNGEPFVQFPRPPASMFAHFVERLFEEAGVTPQLVQITEELQTAVGLVAAGFGFTLVPGSVQSLHREGLTFRPITPPPPTIRLCVASRSDETSPIVPRFLAVAREAAGGS